MFAGSFHNTKLQNDTEQFNFSPIRTSTCLIVGAPILTLKTRNQLDNVSTSAKLRALRKSFALLAACCLSFMFWTHALAGAKVAPRLASQLAGQPSTGPILAWVYFEGKGTHELEKPSSSARLVSERSIHRRLKVRLAEEVLDYTDLPIDDGYSKAVAARVLRLRQRSKWLNAVSVEATPAQIESLEALPFVKSIDAVAQFRVERPREGSEEPGSATLPPTTSTTASIQDLPYGPSLNQVAMINVSALHNMGNHAEGVLVGVFDNGFRLLQHQAFDSLRSRIIATYDFVDHKESVVPNNPNPDFGGHGINTLSALAGYYPGQLIGPAFGASFVLARTENDSSGSTLDYYPSEEDNWIAAIEWADSIGIDVSSTSLGYLGHLPPATSWTWQDMNGVTIPITRAADIAVSKGIIVCNSAGNDALDGTPNTLNAPADGLNVIAVGAVDPSGVRTYFSSYGPTADGRIKPDLMAQGSDVYVASSTNPSGYSFKQGTSFSCPLAAGAAALLVKAYPNATPLQIQHALKSTASRSVHPDNYYGWGIIDVLGAYMNMDTTYSPEQSGVSPFLSQNYPNPFNLQTRFHVQLPGIAHVQIVIYDVLGRQVSVVVDSDLGPGSYEESWDGKTAAGELAATGFYMARMETTTGNGQVQRMTRKVLLIR
jgi:serine protease AprX